MPVRVPDRAIRLHPLACALIALAVSALVTGALHEDGLADVADGFGGGGNKAARLKIMRDSRIGTFGVLAVLFSVGIRAGIVAGLPGPGLGAAALIAAAALSRGFLPAAMHFMAPARKSGLAAKAGKPDREGWIKGLALGALLSRGQARGFGFSKLLSIGNESDLSVGEVVDFLVDDPDTGAILLFLETLRRAEDLALAARRAYAAGKPVIAYKIGRSDAGQQMAVSHSGALAGPDAAATAFSVTTGSSASIPWKRCWRRRIWCQALSPQPGAAPR